MWVNWEGICKQEAEEKELVKTMAQQLFWVHQSTSIIAGQSGLWPNFLFKLKSLFSFDYCVSIELRQTAVYTGVFCAHISFNLGIPIVAKWKQKRITLVWYVASGKYFKALQELFSLG